MNLIRAPAAGFLQQFDMYNLTALARNIGASMDARARALDARTGAEF